MKLSMIRILLVSSLVLFGNSALAGTFGVGVGLGDSSLTTSDQAFAFPVLYLPMILSGPLMFEGEIGMWTRSTEGQSSSEKTSRVGVGVLVGKIVNDGFGYGGARVRLESPGAGPKFWVTSIVIGGEHRLSPHFGLGVEGKLNYASTRSERDEYSMLSTGGNESTVYTSAELRARYYF